MRAFVVVYLFLIIISRMQIYVNQLHIRYEDNVSNPQVLFAWCYIISILFIYYCCYCCSYCYFHRVNIVRYCWSLIIYIYSIERLLVSETYGRIPSESVCVWHHSGAHVCAVHERQMAALPHHLAAACLSRMISLLLFSTHLLPR